jgi:hypothetical protein
VKNLSSPFLACAQKEKLPKKYQVLKLILHVLALVQVEVIVILQVEEVT